MKLPCLDTTHVGLCNYCGAMKSRAKEQIVLNKYSPGLRCGVSVTEALERFLFFRDGENRPLFWGAYFVCIAYHYTLRMYRHNAVQEAIVHPSLIKYQLEQIYLLEHI